MTLPVGLCLWSRKVIPGRSEGRYMNRWGASWVNLPQDLLKLWIVAQKYVRERRLYNSTAGSFCQSGPPRCLIPLHFWISCVRSFRARSKGSGLRWDPVSCPCEKLVTACVEVAAAVAKLRGAERLQYRDLLWVCPAPLFSKHLDLRGWHAVKTQ